MSSSSEDSVNLEEVQNLLTYLINPRSEDDHYHGADLYKHIRIVQARLRPAVSVTFRMKIPQDYSNRVNNMHGGAQAMIFDNLSSVAICLWAMSAAPQDSPLRDIWVNSGVSRTLNVSYVRPAPVESEVDIENVVVNVGKRLALVRGEMRHPENGKVLATFEHHKAALKGWPKAQL
ncbi:MAG: hypothetical protein Q9227_004618 [Pyrenula ochraceoflavens]